MFFYRNVSIQLSFCICTVYVTMHLSDSNLAKKVCKSLYLWLIFCHLELRQSLSKYFDVLIDLTYLACLLEVYIKKISLKVVKHCTTKEHSPIYSALFQKHFWRVSILLSLSQAKFLEPVTPEISYDKSKTVK